MTKETPRIVLPHSEADTRVTTLSDRPVDLKEAIEVLLLIRMKPQVSGVPSLDQLVQTMASQAPHERKYLSHQDVTDHYGAQAEDVDLINEFAKEYGLTIKEPLALETRTITLRGALRDIARAFDITFVHRNDERGVQYRSYEGPLTVPEPIAPVVSAAVGLDSRPVVRRASRPPSRPSSSSSSSPSLPKAPYLPTEVAEFYNFPSDYTGTGQCVGILELGGGYEPSDLTDYFDNIVKLDPPPPPVVNVPTDGNKISKLVVENYEVTQDIEIASAMAPGAQIVVYFSPSGTNELKMMLEVLDRAIFDRTNRPSVLSLSWQMPETALQNPQSKPLLLEIDTRFRIAAAMGITICACTGDSGALTYYAHYTVGQSYNNAFGAPPEVNFPATSPYVLACGGTTLKGAKGTRVAEEVWNCYAELMTVIGTNPLGKQVSLPSNGGASTGGVSVLYSPPAYQSEANVPLLKTATWDEGFATDFQTHAGRGVPDVAGNADFNTGYSILFQGKPATGGGTSAAAPAWAALVARLNQALGHRVGYLNPLLYRLQTVENADVMNRIDHGNNGGYEARPDRAWNACTGLGSPNGEKLLQVLREQPTQRKG